MCVRAYTSEGEKKEAEALKTRILFLLLSRPISMYLAIRNVTCFIDSFAAPARASNKELTFLQSKKRDLKADVANSYV